MILLVAGGTHTGKTLAAQKLLEAFHVPYLSIDHLKMGLIRSGMCPLSPESSDEELTASYSDLVTSRAVTALFSCNRECEINSVYGAEGACHTSTELGSFE